jgi:ribosome recycling factor
MVDNEKVEEILLILDDKLEKTLSVLKEDYSVIRAGRANPQILSRVMVNYYGTPTPINQVGNISVFDPKCLVISPWDTSILKEIEKGILQANIGITPINDGKLIRLSFPNLTEERRKELVKQIKKMGEDTKVAQRNIRRDAMDGLKKMKTGKEMSEDEFSTYEKDVDKSFAKYVEKLEKMITEKEKDIMSI